MSPQGVPVSRSRRVRSVLVLVSLLGGLLAPALTAAAETAPTRLITHAEGVRGRYIVVLRPASLRSTSASTTSLLASDLSRAYGGRVTRVFGAVLDGYAAKLTAAQATRLARDPSVAYVEQDMWVHVDATQAPAPWDLDRLDQHPLPVDGSYTYGTDGTGVTAYVIDTGIRLSHQQFGGRATSGFDVVDGGPAEDCNGHGTHVAGTVGGSTYGVAKDVSLVAVRVLNCRGSGLNSGVIAGIDWVTADHGPGEAAVANMSLGGRASSALDQAVANSIADGVVYAIAAGNGGLLGNAKDACTTSPARVPAAITVSATDSTDTKASWANTGTCVDVFAPGVSITSAWIGSDTATDTVSGTSMASPHVAGVAAMYLEAHPTATPAQVGAAIVAGATIGIVNSPGTGSPNRLLYSTFGETPPITLSVTGSVTLGGKRAVLAWSGATTPQVDVYRNGVFGATTANDGTATDTTIGSRTGTFTYHVCEAGTSVCSNPASVTF